MTGRRTMMVLATALLAGSLLETGAEASGGARLVQRWFHGWLRRRSWWRLWRRPCWRLRRKSHGWLRRNSHGGHGPRSPWLWKASFRRLLRLRQLSVLHVIRLAV